MVKKGELLRNEDSLSFCIYSESFTTLHSLMVKKENKTNLKAP
jgi:hypothetical protein